MNRWWLKLTLLISLTYIPFLNFRMIRTAGDDKVYVAQAVEMARSGSWFLQTLAGEPNYFKGPLHYILLRIGILLFGNSMAASVYMNYLLVLLGALALGAVVRRHLPEKPQWAFFIGGAFAFSIGIFSFTFASQMEVELAAFYAFGLFFLDYVEVNASMGLFGFWWIAGLMGWIKFPIFSVLLGSSGLLYWLLNGTLLRKMRTGKFWLSPLTGIILCCAGYAPAFFLDRVPFVKAYLTRENLNSQHGTWDEAIVSLLTFFLLPWMFLAFVSYLDALIRLGRNVISRRFHGMPALVSLPLAILLPTVLFFIEHPYHGQSYNLPLIGALLILIGYLWSSSTGRFPILYKAAYGVTSMFFLIPLVLIGALASRFTPLPDWWPAWLFPMAFVLTVPSLGVTWFHFFKNRRPNPQFLVYSAAASFFVLGGLLCVLGERELRDVRSYLTASEISNPIRYFDLQKNTWSEWGYLNLMLNRQVYVVREKVQILEALKGKETLLLPDSASLQQLQEIASSVSPPIPLTTIPWKRWTIVHGIHESGDPYWLVAWKRRDLSLLERDAYIVKASVYPK